MKIGIVTSLMLSLVLYSCGGKDQSKVKEGVLTFSIDYPENKDNFFLYHVLPKELKASFKEDKMELKIKKANMENTIIVDGKNKAICAYYNYGEEFSTNLTDDDERLIINKQPKYKIRFTNEKDTLAGFDIKKAIAIDPQHPKEKIEIWYTDQIVFKNPNWFNGFDQIPGVMLKYSMVQYDMKMEFVARKFEDVTISDSIVTMKRPGINIAHSEFDKKIINLFESFK